MQSLSGPVPVGTPNRGSKAASPGNTLAALLASIALLACLSSCSLVDSRPDADGGPVDARDSMAGKNPGEGGSQAVAGEQGLESIVAQLVDEQKQYEARLLALEAIVLRGYPLAPAAGYPDTQTSAGSTAAAAQLASLPIEPDVIIQPVAAASVVEPQSAPVALASAGVSGMAPPAEEQSPVKTPVQVSPPSAAKASAGVSGMAPPAEEQSPVKTPVQASPPPAAKHGSWVINLGSYSNKTVADRMLAGFRQQDVDAEQIEVLVNDRTMYRVRIAGFDTRQAANLHVQSLNWRLGIEDVWIMRK